MASGMGLVHSQPSLGAHVRHFYDRFGVIGGVYGAVEYCLPPPYDQWLHDRAFYTKFLLSNLREDASTSLPSRHQL